MSVFTPGDFTDLTGEGETEAGWLTFEEHQDPRAGSDGTKGGTGT